VHEVDAADTHTRGQASALIQVARLNLKLLPERERTGDVLTLGVARVVERRDDGTVVLDANYLPPVQDCRALPALQAQLKELQGLLRHRAQALAARVSAAGRGGMGEVADFLLLQLSNRYEAQLGQLAQRGAVHPQEFHALAVQLAAELATYTQPAKRPPEFAPYRLHDLQTSFQALMAELRRSLAMVFEQSAVELPLEAHKYGIRVATITDRSLLGHASLVLAVRASLPAEDLRRRFPPQAKIGSVEVIRQLVNLQLPGIGLRALPVAPRQLPYHAGCTYFELERSGEAWAGLEHSGGIAIHVSGDFPGLELEFWAIRD
jgi:type VI secretion system protein ImpJ